MPVAHPSHPELFHTGIVVEDIHTAIAAYTSLGVTFTEVREITLDVLLDGEKATERMLAAYTTQGPPYVELIQELDGDIWGPAALNLNHLGYWVDDVDEAVRRLQEEGWVVRIVSATSPSRMAYLSGPGNVWVELCAPGVQSMLGQWLMTTYQGPEASPASFAAPRGV